MLYHDNASCVMKIMMFPKLASNFAHTYVVNNKNPMNRNWRSAWTLYVKHNANFFTFCI